MKQGGPLITSAKIKIVAEGRLIGLQWKEIAAILKIHIGTLEDWRTKANTATKGIYKELADALDIVEATLIEEAFETVKAAATKKRVTKVVTKTYIDKEGNEITEITEHEEGPSTRDAWKILERKRNETWGVKDEPKKTRDESGPDNSATEINELDDALSRVENEPTTTDK